ncbi:MAG: stage V sporulation protein AA [Tissierellaceae bacterium]
MSKENVFVLLDKKYTVDVDQNILIKDIGKVCCNDKDIQKKIEDLKVKKSSKNENWDYIESTDVLNKILEYDPQLNITMLGEYEVLIEIKSREDKNGVLQFLKVLFISIVLFFGAGMAIVNFYEDVNMVASLNKIYYTFTGISDTKPLIMTIPYSLGLGVGVMTFFNRVVSSSKRRKKEPGPMELELYLYDSDMEDYILNDIKKIEDSDG